MEERRGHLRMDLMSQIFRIGTVPDGTCQSCLYREVRSMDYIGHMFGRLDLSTRGWVDGTLEPNRISQIPIDEVIATLSPGKMSTSSLQCKDSSTHIDPCFEERTREATTRFKDSLQGLCLACVRRGDSHKNHAK